MAEKILLILAFLSGLTMTISGGWFIFQALFAFRRNINRSLNENLVIIRVVRPKEEDRPSSDQGNLEKEEIGKMEQMLVSLSKLPARKKIFFRLFYGPPQVCFEMASPSGWEKIVFFVTVSQRYQELVQKQIYSFYPNAKIEKAEDFTIFQPEGKTVASYLKFKKDDSFPLKTFQYMDNDPLHNIASALSKLEGKDEGAAIQIVFRSSQANWRPKGVRVAERMQQGSHIREAEKINWYHELSRGMGKGAAEILKGGKKDEMNGENKGQDRPDNPVSLTPEEQELIKRLENKANKPHFDVNIRLLASASTQERAEDLLAHLENAFIQFEDANLNKLVAVRSRKKNAPSLSFDFIFRNYNSSQGVVMDTEELASVFHFPISTTKTPKLELLRSKTAAPPDNIPQEGLLLGYSDFRGGKTDIRLSPDDRRRHLYIIGQTGTGKSTFIEELAKQDAKNKEGFCIIEPHGDLIEHVLECIPKERAEDVIYFDPADTERPFGLNMMEYDEKRPEQKTFVINEMISIFDKLYDLKQTGGPMFEQYMRNAMLLVLDSPELGSTMLEIPRVFRDVDFRKKKLAKCRDMTVIEFWEKEAEKAGGDAALENIAPYITSKLTTFISNDMMRPIIAQQKSTIDFRKVMDEGKILLVNLSKGKIGEINSHLLGMVIVSKLLMAALGRVDLPEKDRKDFYLYIDEFQNFTTDSIAQILSEARKYRLCLNIAHQFIGQLSDEISKAVFGNVGSLCSFRVGSEDAEFLEKQFAPVFEASDLVNVGNFECYTKLLINNMVSDAFNMKTNPPSKGSVEMREALKELSRFRLGRSREVVEREIKERYFQAGQTTEEVEEETQKNDRPVENSPVKDYFAEMKDEEEEELEAVMEEAKEVKKAKEAKEAKEEKEEKEEKSAESAERKKSSVELDDGLEEKKQKEE